VPASSFSNVEVLLIGWKSKNRTNKNITKRR
jgi:hypothetical protein